MRVFFEDQKPSTPYVSSVSSEETRVVFLFSPTHSHLFHSNYIDYEYSFSPHTHCLLFPLFLSSSSSFSFFFFFRLFLSLFILYPVQLAYMLIGGACASIFLNTHRNTNTQNDSILYYH